MNGQSAIDQSAVTGETVPEDVSPGNSVYAGTINVSGVLRIAVTHTGEATAIGRVLDTLRDAERSKHPSCRYSNDMPATICRLCSLSHSPLFSSPGM